MEKPRRVSIATLGVVVAVAALDLAWWRHITVGQHASILRFPGPALDAPVMPMASVLLVGLAYVLTNRGRVPRYLIGFLVGGLVGLMLYLIYNWVGPLLRNGFFFWSMRPIYAARERWPRLASFQDYLYYADIVYYSPPQFAIAGLVGLIWPKPREPIVDRSDLVSPRPT